MAGEYLPGLPRMLRSAEKPRLECSMVRPMLKYLEDRFPPRPDRLSGKIEEARREARHLRTKFHTGKLPSIKCHRHRGHANAESPATNDESTAPS
jgi:hypothetical protein